MIRAKNVNTCEWRFVRPYNGELVRRAGMVNIFVHRVYFRIHLSSLCDLISIVRPSVRGVKRGVKFIFLFFS